MQSVFCWGGWLGGAALLCGGVAHAQAPGTLEADVLKQ